ncbi:MAG TPA: hypothetical protein VFW19_14110 [Allosphingosinicella sp.]|nr:hypothetical protein [Allosphingosinicella sp.]
MKRVRTCLACLSAAAIAGTAAGPARAQAAPAAAAHDGRHDFDFHFGTWTTHIARRAHPFSGSDAMVHLTGTVTVRKVWDGAAQLEEIEADGPAGHWEGMSLFLYNPAARQWSQSFIAAEDGTLGAPLVGAFADGVGRLYGQDILDGRAILVRGTWSGISADACRYEEAYSADGGRTWESEFSASLTRGS